MGVQRYELLELSVDNPPGRTVGILALDPKDGLVAVERMQAVTDPDPKPMEKDGHTTVAFLVSFEPKLEHEGRKAASYELIGDIYAMWGEGAGASCLRGLRVTLGDDGGG